MNLESALKYVRNCFESDRMAHAYIVAGPPRGEGGAFVRGVLGMVFCAEPGKACGACDACRKIESWTHPDIVRVEPQTKSRRISVEQIRDLQQMVFQTAYLGGWKGVVIFHADRLVEEAANAFLKTLEEPPRRSIFFMVTDSPQFLLPTILSRCQRIDISSQETRLEGEYMERFLALLVEGGGGRNGPSVVAAEKTARFFGELKAQAGRESAADAEAAPEGDDDTLDARTNSRYREMRAAAVRTLLSWHRDILLLACGGSPDEVYNRGYLQVLGERAGKLTPAAALANIRAVEELYGKMERNIPDAVVIREAFGALN